MKNIWQTKSSMEKITFTTEDGVLISGLLWDAQSRTTVLLLHMMPATKDSWIQLANRLFHRGMNVLAIDLRGHGDSGGGSYKKFTPEEHYGYFKDKDAALAFIKERFPKTEILMGGASIGANLSLGQMADDRSIKKGFALSAGLDYYGVRAIDFVKKLDSEQGILLVGSRDDGRSDGQTCGDMAEQLGEAATSHKQVIVYDTGGHGTDMWEEHPELLSTITDFLVE